VWCFSDYKSITKVITGFLALQIHATFKRYIYYCSAEDSENLL